MPIDPTTWISTSYRVFYKQFPKFFLKNWNTMIYYYYYYCCCCKTLSRRVWTFITTCTTAQSGVLFSARWNQLTPQRTVSRRLGIPNGIARLPHHCYTLHSSIFAGIFRALLTFSLVLQNCGSFQFPSGTALLSNVECCFFLLVCSLQWITCFEKSCSSDLHCQM